MKTRNLVMGFLSLTLLLPAASFAASTDCVQSSPCVTVEYQGEVTVGNQTTITFKVTHGFCNAISFLAIGTNDWTRIAPPNGSVYGTLLQDYDVEWTGTSGLPGFKSIKFDAQGGVLKDGASDTFVIVVEDFDPNETIVIAVKFGPNTDTFNFLPAALNCDPTPGDCIQESECVLVEFLGYYSVGEETTLSFMVCQGECHAISFVAFGTSGFTRIAPPDNSTYNGLLQDYNVEWTGASGLPGFESIKFDALGSALVDGACEVFEIVVEDFDPDETIVIAAKYGTTTDTFNFLPATLNCGP